MASRLRTYARRFALVVLTAYAVVCGLMFGLQRRLLFPAPAQMPFPEGWNVQTSATGLPIAVFAGRPAVVYFHGNATSVARLGHVQKQISDQGFGLILPEYPGYAGAPGTPIEAGIFAAARVGIVPKQRWPPPRITQLLGRRRARHSRTIRSPPPIGKPTWCAAGSKHRPLARAPRSTRTGVARGVLPTGRTEHCWSRTHPIAGIDTRDACATRLTA